MKRLLEMILFTLLLPIMLCSCVDNKYDLSDIDDSGGFSPALTLPIGSLKTSIIDFIKGAGIEDELQIAGDTIYVGYRDSMQLTLNFSSKIPEFEYVDVIRFIPPGIVFDFDGDGGEASIEIDIFKNLASSDSFLKLYNPSVSFMIKNYIGANITVDINSIKSEGNGEVRSATFGDDNSESLSIDVNKAPHEHEFSTRKETFDRSNGKMNELFSISPERISYDFSVDLAASTDNSFIVKDKYVDVEYEIKIPFTFEQGTRLVNADTLDFDLSGDDFIGSIDDLTLWINYKNSLSTTVNLEILFLDEYKREIQNIGQTFKMDAASASSPEDPFEFEFGKDKLDDAKKAKYTVLKSILTTDKNVNIRPSDSINLMLSAYSKINI
jgi:hypothetical protein